jgi:hypothetical protein
MRQGEVWTYQTSELDHLDAEHALSKAMTDLGENKYLGAYGWMQRYFYLRAARNEVSKALRSYHSYLTEHGISAPTPEVK